MHNPAPEGHAPACRNRTAAAVVVFWLAAFFVGGDKQTAAELAQTKGQMVAVEQVSIAKKCNIQFQSKPDSKSEGT